MKTMSYLSSFDLTHCFYVFCPLFKLCDQASKTFTGKEKLLKYRIDVDDVKVTLVPRLSDNVFITCVSVSLRKTLTFRYKYYTKKIHIQIILRVTVLEVK